MKYLVLGLLLAFQVAQEPYPGQSQHAEPPAGWFCVHQNYELNIPPAHACNCERSCDETGKVVEDKTCTVWCHADHCHCEMANMQACK